MNDIANYLPIRLLSNLYKLSIKIIANRSENKLDVYQHVEQASKKVLELSKIYKLIEKSHEYNLWTSLAFIDYEKALDTIETAAILEALYDARIDIRHSNIIKNIYAKATRSIKLKSISEKINVERGIRQGDTLPPKLFTLTFENIFIKLNWSGMSIHVDEILQYNTIIT